MKNEPKKTQFKLGWLNATIWQRASDCFQLTIEYPVKVVQCFKTKAEAMNVLKQFELAHKSK